MRALTRPLLLGMLAAGAAFAQPATAATYCLGEASLVVVCADTPDPVVGSRDLCVYVLSTSCTTVTVPTAGVVGNADVNCGGNSLRATCYVVNNLIP